MIGEKKWFADVFQSSRLINHEVLTTKAKAKHFLNQNMNKQKARAD